MKHQMQAFVAAYNSGRLDEAERIARSLVSLDRHNSRYGLLLGVTLLRLGRSREAVEALQSASIRSPKDADILNALAAALNAAGRSAEAVGVCRQALACRPNSPDVLNNLGNALQQRGALDEAIETYRKALSFKPNHIDALYNLGAALTVQDRCEEAVAAYRRVIALQPNHPQALNNLGNVLYRQGKLNEAVASFREALRLWPASPETLVNLGVALRDRGEVKEAIEAYRRALSIVPDHFEALVNLGIALQDVGQSQDAIAAFQRAIDLRPQSLEPLINLGSVLEEQDRSEEAVAVFRKALALKADSVEALSNLGTALHSLGEIDAAITLQRQALARDPGYADAAYNLSISLLLKGDWSEGWPLFEARGRRRNPTYSVLPLPRWTGASLPDGRLLLTTEQGLGDAIQFARFASHLRAEGIDAVLQVKPKLIGLFNTLRGNVPLMSTEEPLRKDITTWCPLMSVPALLGTTLETLPSAVPYLAADPARVSAWAERIGNEGFKIGIAWQGNPAGRIDHGRSFALSEFAPLASLSGVRLIALQKGHGCEQVADATFHVETLGADFDNGPDAFLDTAAVMMSLDMIITSDTSIAHLAGALGRPVWIALKYVPDWRWMMGRGDSPWYPTARLFRQTRRGDWAGVFQKIAAAIPLQISGSCDRHGR